MDFNDRRNQSSQKSLHTLLYYSIKDRKVSINFCHSQKRF